jgi:hypothetical protein
VRPAPRSGLTVSPLAGFTSAACLTLYLGLFDQAAPAGFWQATLLGGTVVGTIFIAPVTLIVLPYVRARRTTQSWNSLIAHAASGAVAGFFCPTLFLVPLALARAAQLDFLRQVSVYALIFGAFEAVDGLMAAMTYYAIAYQRDLTGNSAPP